MLHEKSGKTWHAEQRSLSGDSKLTEQTLTVFSIFLLDHIISEEGELFVLFAYHTTDDYYSSHDES